MNTQTQEALKMAIEALAKCKEAYLAGPNWQKVGYDILDKSQQACKEALAQPAQEPVAWMEVKKDVGFKCIEVWQEPVSKNSIPLYTHPAQEPVALYKNGNVDWIKTPLDMGKPTPLYTHPAPSWQGLESEKVTQIIHGLEDKLGMPIVGAIAVARAIEQALKEENHA